MRGGHRNAREKLENQGWLADNKELREEEKGAPQERASGVGNESRMHNRDGHGWGAARTAINEKVDVK